MTKLKFYLIALIILQSCGIKTYKLKNGITKVPKNPRVYSNKSKFNPSILKLIDTMAIFEEIFTISYVNKSIFKPREKEYLSTSYPSTSFKGFYRFYNNGCYNLFILRNGENNFTSKMFDPKYLGWRGVYYLDKKNNIIGDLVTRISGSGEIGIRKEIIEFKEDTLFVTSRSSNTKDVYIKRKFPSKLLGFTAEW